MNIYQDKYLKYKMKYLQSKSSYHTGTPNYFDYSEYNLPKGFDSALEGREKYIYDKDFENILDGKRINDLKSLITIDNVNAVEVLTMTPLMYALRNENVNLEIIRFLVENGATVIDSDKHEKTPLMYAVGNRNINLAIITLLVENGATINANSEYITTIISYGLSNKNINIKNYLLKSNFNYFS